jgi:hypothetical protein
MIFETTSCQGFWGRARTKGPARSEAETYGEAEPSPHIWRRSRDEKPFSKKQEPNLVTQLGFLRNDKSRSTKSHEPSHTNLHEEFVCVRVIGFVLFRGSFIPSKLGSKNKKLRLCITDYADFKKRAPSLPFCFSLTCSVLTALGSTQRYRVAWWYCVLF